MYNKDMENQVKETSTTSTFIDKDKLEPLYFSVKTPNFIKQNITGFVIGILTVITIMSVWQVVSVKRTLVEYRNALVSNSQSINTLNNVIIQAVFPRIGLTLDTETGQIKLITNDRGNN